MNLDSNSTNLGSRKFAKLLITAGAVWIALVCAFLSFFTYEWIWGTEKGRKQLPALENEFAQITLPSSDSVIRKFTSYKSTHATVSKTVSTSQNWNTLRDFYTAEMQKVGWVHTESRKVLEWNRDLGGKAEHFKKGPYEAELFYFGPSSQYPGKYNLDITINLPLFGEKK